MKQECYPLHHDVRRSNSTDIDKVHKEVQSASVVEKSLVRILAELQEVVTLNPALRLSRTMLVDSNGLQPSPSKSLSTHIPFYDST